MKSLLCNFLREKYHLVTMLLDRKVNISSVEIKWYSNYILVANLEMNAERLKLEHLNVTATTNSILPIFCAVPLLLLVDGHEILDLVVCCLKIP